MRLQRDALLAFGATLGGVGIALCIAEGGGHPLRKLWFLVGVGCLLVGFGVLAAAAPELPVTSVQHDQQLRMMLGGARSSIEGERGCPFADPARSADEGGSEEFQRHFHRLAKHLAPWNAATTRHYSSRESFLAKLTSESEDRLPGAPLYRVDVIAKDLAGIIMRRALNDRLSHALSFEPDSTGEVWTGCSVVELPPADGLRLARDRDWAISMSGSQRGSSTSARSRPGPSPSTSSSPTLCDGPRPSRSRTPTAICWSLTGDPSYERSASSRPSRGSAASAAALHAAAAEVSG